MCWGGVGREVFYFENEFWAGLPAEAAGPLSPARSSHTDSWEKSKSQDRLDTLCIIRVSLSLSLPDLPKSF